MAITTSCSSDDDYKNNPVEASNLTIQLAENGTFGSIMVNQNNQSMYFFAGDVTGVSNCNGGCADVWPPVIEDLSQLELGAGLNATLFGNITREDGQNQITFKGWPLYYFSPDADGVLENPGATLGDGRGDAFYILKPDYSIFFGRQVLEEGAEATLYLVDENGVTLYFTAGDNVNVSNCAGGCAGVWPPSKVPENMILPSLLGSNSFAIVDRNDELSPQLSFMGSPLYRFTPDEGVRGNVLGQAGGPGANFFVLEPLQ